jgi:hypothetical protein
MKFVYLSTIAILLFAFFVGCEDPVTKDVVESDRWPSTEVDSAPSAAEVKPSGEDQLDASPTRENSEQSKPGALDLTGQPKIGNGLISSVVPQFKILSWNVESDGADPIEICRQLGQLNENDKYDIVGLTEVMPADLSKFRNALGKHYKYAYSKTGYNDRLQLLYNEDVFEKVRHLELNEINPTSRYRSPLVAHLRHRKTKTEFLVMLNHLARGKAEIRQRQASLLVEWARNETMPVIAVGDYNFDYVFETEKGNPAFANMLRDNIWKWVKPEEMIDTNWYDQMNPDGIDDYPGSMLDFAFVANAAKAWKLTCRVIVRDGDFPDDEKTSDHRPFELIFE